MNPIALNCRQCGAPLQVPEDLKHVTCMHCGTQLAVVHEGGAAYTEKLDQIAQKTEQIESKLDQLQRQQKLTSLDHEWEISKESFYIQDKQGQRRLPSKSASIAIFIMGGIAACAAAGVGFALLYQRSEGNVPAALPIGAAIVVAIATLWNGLAEYARAEQYEQAKRRYHARRRKLLDG
ncbi:hypothetical protein GC197_18140 [bacterium]|nr:hypothetical protein [bacterium]